MARRGFGSLRFRGGGPGCGFNVTVGEEEVREFKRRWPASGLGRGPYWFAFSSNGDLEDLAGPGASSWADGPALLALSEDAQAYGECRQTKKRGCRKVFESGEGGSRQQALSGRRQR